jgi:hypothetical protein
MHGEMGARLREEIQCDPKGSGPFMKYPRLCPLAAKA